MAVNWGGRNQDFVIFVKKAVDPVLLSDLWHLASCSRTPIEHRLASPSSARRQPPASGLAGMIAQLPSLLGKIPPLFRSTGFYLRPRILRKRRREP